MGWSGEINKQKRAGVGTSDRSHSTFKEFSKQIFFSLCWYLVDASSGKVRLLSSETNHRVDPRSLNFKKNSHGKPEVEWKNADGWQPPPLHFNLSHTSSLIACGVTVDSPIGIDVEDKQRKLKKEILAFARRYFSSHEVEHLSSISDIEIQRQQFTTLWTLKEAYVKALGKGFSASPFKTFTIRFRDAAKGGVDSSGDVNSEISEISVEPHEKLAIFASRVGRLSLCCDLHGKT
ncbi:uncharacterized protein LOC126600393 [Malus sylvestris]|uniref:uncharacterized protein LOC126600393 n=1 Tax=Malus sylvestris TaxID=3752 RepID=UPI0021AD3556|nr:uncharacterized protein LOC126600393 [Malus sylvestris]